MSTVIKVANISKQYRLGQVGTGTISHDVNRWWHKIRGKEDPYLKIGESNDRTVKGDSDYVWALKDINFEVKQGEVLGIIGRNGAGKSTLLKILSRTTSPTTGSVKIKGRVASLLEVGTGFHPELSGRDNIFLNGAILGMTRREIQSKFDEIVDFAGVERYIDTPVKRYSSGMYVRLAFAVAAHLEPEILIVDEVLAVGDAEFQKKALGKMKDVSYKEGRTVLFVSHNLSSIKSLSSRVISIGNGLITGDGDADYITRLYLQKASDPDFEFIFKQVEIIHGMKPLRFFVEDLNNKILEHVSSAMEFRLVIEYEVIKSNAEFGFTIGFWNEFDELVFLTLSNLDPTFLVTKRLGKYRSGCLIPANFLNNKTYSISVNIFDGNYKNGVTFKDVLSLSVMDDSFLRKNYTGGFAGMIRPTLNWETVSVTDPMSSNIN